MLRPTGPHKRKRRTIPVRLLRKKPKMPLTHRVEVEHWILFQEKLFRQYDIESKKDKFYCLQLAARFALIIKQLEQL